MIPLMRPWTVLVTLSLLLLLGGCSTQQGTDQAVAPQSPVVPGEACPDLDGLFVIRNEPEFLLSLMPEVPLGFQPDLLVVASTPDRSETTWTAAYESGRWLAEANRLRERDPARYAVWHAAIVAGDGSAARDIDEVPLPERKLVQPRGECAGHWMRHGVVDVRPGMVRGIGEEHEVTLWFGRGANGDLLVRYDAVRLLDLWITGKPIRTSRITVYRSFPAIRATPAAIGQLPEPVRELTAEEREQAFAGLESRIRLLMPEGMELDRFDMDDRQAAITKGAGRLRLSGTARRNADVSTFLRTMDQQDDLDRVELVSIVVQDGRMRFDIQVDWRRQ